NFTGGTLDLYGDQFGTRYGYGYDDTFNIFSDSSGGVLVGMNNEYVDFAPGQITSIVILPGGGNNTVNIYNTNVPVYVASTSHDTVNVGLGNTSNINAFVYVDNYGGNAAFDVVNVDNSINSTGQSISVGSSEIHGLAPAAIYYNWSFINLFGRSGTT